MELKKCHNQMMISEVTVKLGSSSLKGVDTEGGGAFSWPMADHPGLVTSAVVAGC